MIFTCIKCNAQYKISDDRIPQKGAKVKCKKCGNIITIKPAETDNVITDESFQNEATVVQRSPFEQDHEASGDATRVVSREQAAGIFKNLIEEHSRGYVSQENDVDYDQPSSVADDQQGGGSADDRVTSVYESRPGAEVEDEVEDQVNQMFDKTPEEEDISREATRVVSTEQLKEMVGEEGGFEEKSSKRDTPNYYQMARQPYVAPRSRGEWYIAIGQMQVGPLSLNEVEEKWGRGEINSTTLVWKAGMTNWQPLMYVPDLSHLVPPSQPPKEIEQPPIKEFAHESKQNKIRGEISTSSAFPSLDELSRQEEDLKTKKEEELPLDWKPAAGDALASLVQDEMESIKRGFSTDIPISDVLSKPEEKRVGIPTVGIDSSSLSFGKHVDGVQITSVPQDVSVSPVTYNPPREQPVIVGQPYQQPSYPSAYPPIYSQPPAKVSKKGWLIPLLIGVSAIILVTGSVVGYVIYTRLTGEKVQTQDNQQQQKIAQPQQPIQQQPQQPIQEQPQQPIQPPPQQQQAMQEPPQKVTPPSSPQEGQKEEMDKKVEMEETKKEDKAQRIKTAKKEERSERAEKQSQKRQATYEREVPSQPKEEGSPKPQKEIAKAEVSEPPKKRSTKGSDALLDFEGEEGADKSKGGLPKTLTQEQILEVVKANISRIKVCMSEQAKRDPSVKGKLIIGWEIQPNGRTRSVQIKSAQFKGTYIGTCISSVVTDFTFPKFSGPPIPIEFPFNIK